MNRLIDGSSFSIWKVAVSERLKKVEVTRNKIGERGRGAITERVVKPLGR